MCSSSSSSSSRDEYYLGGTIALLLQDHRMSNVQYNTQTRANLSSMHLKRDLLSADWQRLTAVEVPSTIKHRQLAIEDLL